jgi:hypothetical protein
MSLREPDGGHFVRCALRTDEHDIFNECHLSPDTVVKSYFIFSLQQIDMIWLLSVVTTPGPIR